MSENADERIKVTKLSDPFKDKAPRLTAASRPTASGHPYLPAQISVICRYHEQKGSSVSHRQEHPAA